MAEEARYNGIEIISEDTMAENVPELVKDTNPKIQESLQSPSNITYNVKQIILRVQKTRDKAT